MERGPRAPASPPRSRTGVEPGDVIRTKTMSKAKAQLTMVDASIITLAPDAFPMADIEAGSGKISWP